MILLYLLTLIGLACSQELEVDPSCPSCVIVDGACFNATLILELQTSFRKTDFVHKMGILRSTNMLFFSFHPPIEDVEYSKIGFVNLDNHDQTGVIEIPKRISNFGPFDIDQDNEFVYMGGSDGVFVLDAKEAKFAQYSSMGDTIESIFFKTNVNFVKQYERGITVKRGDNFKTLLEDTIVKNFVITKYDVIVFLSNLGLFVGKGDMRYRVSKNAFFRGLIIDLDGVVYAWWIDSIYKVIIEKNLHDSSIVKVATIPVTIGAMAFDNDNNILFTVKKELFKLNRTETGCKPKKTKETEFVRA